MHSCFCLFELEPYRLRWRAHRHQQLRRLPASDSAASTPPSAPAEHWGLSRATAAGVGVAQTDVDAILDHLFSDAATQSALVSKDGYVVGERYADGFDADSLGTSWSVAKSFYSAAMGVAIEEGHFCFGESKGQHGTNGVR